MQASYTPGSSSSSTTASTSSSSLTLTSPQSKILSLFEQIEENSRTPYLKLIVIYLLSCRKLPIESDLDFLDSFFVADNEKMSFITRDILEEVLKLLNTSSLQKMQERENLLAVLVPGYQSQNVLTLSSVIIRRVGMSYLKSKLKEVEPQFASKENEEESFNSVREKFSQYETTMTKARFKDFNPGLLKNLKFLYLENVDFTQFSDESIGEFISLASSSPTIMMALLHIIKSLGEESNKLMSCLKQFYLEVLHSPRSGIDEYNMLLSLIKLYPELLLTLRDVGIEGLYNENGLPLLSLARNSKGVALLHQLFFDENNVNDFVNEKFIQYLCALGESITNIHHETALTACLANLDGFLFLTKVFEQKPELADHIPCESFYQQMVVEEGIPNDRHGWCAFSLFLFHFHANPVKSALICSVLQTNPALTYGLTYPALCDILEAHQGYFVLPKGDRCSALGLLVQKLGENEVFNTLLYLLLDSNPSVAQQITVQDLCAIQILYGNKFTVYECLVATEPGKQLLSKLLENNNITNEDILCEQTRVKVKDEMEERIKNNKNNCCLS